MKKTIPMIIGACLLASSCVFYVPKGYDAPGYGRGYPGSRSDSEMNIGYVYDYLDPYGFWVNSPPYGYVWVPSRMSYDWHPYTRGHWVWTDYGWT